MIHGGRLKPEARGVGMTSQGTRDRLVRRLRDHGIRDEQVLNAIAVTPRHEFVDEALSSRAYEDTALPIGLNQTISQPWVVAKMTEALMDGGSPAKVLEVGTGSGYQAAVLAALIPKVFTVERMEKLMKQARRRFHKLKLRRLQTTAKGPPSRTLSKYWSRVENCLSERAGYSVVSTAQTLMTNCRTYQENLRPCKPSTMTTSI